jgi:hypothetical protein
MMSTSSEEGSGSKIRLPSVVLTIASTLLQLTNLKKRKLMCHGAQFLALVIGARLTPALRSCPLQEATIAVEAQKPGLSLSRKRRSMEAENAATTMETRMHSPAASVVVNNTAKVNGENGVSVALRVVEEASREPLPSHNRKHAMVRHAWLLMRRERPAHAMTSHAPSIAKDLGANSANAVKRAPTARAMVLLAPSSRRTLSMSRQSMVATSAPLKMVKPRRRPAMTNAAQWIALGRGNLSLIAQHHVETESRIAPTLSPSLRNMVARNAHVATIRLTPLPAMRVPALCTVKACGQNGRLVPRNVMVERRNLGSFSTFPLRMEGKNVRTPREL